MRDRVSALRNGLIVSCQALQNEPLHSSFIMGKMALAAKVGGAVGIRANTGEDIREIKRETGMPVIGIVKRYYTDSEVYITPTMKEVDELMEVSTEIIALDATGEIRPRGVKLKDFYTEIRNKFPGALLMADCSTVDEALYAESLGFDFIGTTMVGYTPQSRGKKIEENDFEIIRKILTGVSHPVIAEGNINTPKKARRVLELGCFCVVVGSIITRPQIITKGFVDEINKISK